jgi:hypothetical protein
MEGLTVTVVHARRRNGAAQCELVRCVCGNPYRPTAFDPAWLTTDVTALARVIESAGQFDLLPILADALGDGGCTDAALLGHCRGPGPHDPDCWALAAVLGEPAGVLL